MARPALAALTLAVVVAVAAAPDPCCQRVTPYHIQALAQRMAQRFQALEYRAQDLRYVFASFQAVHGNVSHRLRYLEAEHAHLSELVSRLDSRVQSLEDEKRLEQYRQQVAYYRRGQRNSVLRTPVDDLKKSPRRPPFVMRRRRNENLTELPHLLVHLDQSKESSVEVGNVSFINEATPSADTVNRLATTSETSLGKFTSPKPETVHLSLSVNSEIENVSSDSEQRPSPHSPVFHNPTSEAPPLLMYTASTSDSATPPTPLWQLEETASALLNVMSAGDDDMDDTNVPVGAVDEAVSYWSPANETDSLEELFNPQKQEPTSETLKCTGQSTVNCSRGALGQQPPEGVSNVGTSTEATISESVSISLMNNSSDTALPRHDAVTFLSNIILPSGNGSANNISSEKKTANYPVIKTSGCKSSNRAPPVGEVPVPSDNATNLTRLLLDMGNDTSSLLDIFSAGAEGLGGDASPPPGGSGDGAAPTCGPDGCEAELSDAELQAALRELDALLQRPPASAQPPDPEKVLLKRALTLALAALERTSDACLKLVNFTADAFEGMAATEA